MLAALANFAFWSKVRLRKRGDDFGPWLRPSEGVRRVARRTAFSDFGFKIFIQRRRDRRTLSIHKTETVPPVPDLGCHHEIEKAYAALTREYGKDGIRNGGIWFCRDVDGHPGLRSRHGYRTREWKGAAGDAFSNPDTMPALIRKAQFLVAECRAGRLELDAVIVGNQVWTRSDDQWHHYSGEFHRHIHLEVHAGSPC